MPLDERPNEATTWSMRSEDACGIAMPKPMPVLMVSSRCLSEARMLSRSSALMRPSLTRRSINSTMAGQRSVACISGMICSADNKLASDMHFPIWERKLTVSVSDDKRHLGRINPCELRAQPTSNYEPQNDAFLQICQILYLRD